MRVAGLFLALVLLAASLPAAGQEGPRVRESIRGIIFDPSDYASLNLPVSELAARLTSRWRRHGINVVYVNAYNVSYGAHYRSTHRFNQMDAFGRADLLKAVIDEAHARSIQVFGSLYHHVHRGAWEANPAWRARRRNGTEYNPRGVDAQYFLSVWHPDVQSWWLDLLRELLVNYPDLDGIELREPVINWWAAEADYSQAAVQTFQRTHPTEPLGGRVWLRWRSAGLTALVRRGIRLTHEHGRAVHLTTVMSSWGDGRVLTSEEQAANTGFDLEDILSGADRPDVLKVELIWQQWANIYDYVTFTPTWTGRAAASALAMIADRTRVAIHVELTEFGQRRVTPEETYLAIQAARREGASEFDVYGSKLADDKEAWPWLQRAFAVSASLPREVGETGPARRVLVLEDEDRDRSGVAKLATHLLVNLLGHFDVLVEVSSVLHYRAGELAEFDAVVYQGTQWDAPLPPALLRDLYAFSGTMLWIGANMWRLSRGDDVFQYGVAQPVPVQQFQSSAIVVNGRTLASSVPLNLLSFSIAPGTRVLARGRLGEELLPIAATNGRFWYVGGQLYANAEESPLHLLIADLLHDVLRVPDHAARRALLFISGIHPLIDPAALEGLAQLMHDTGVQPLLGVTPIFVDPGTETRVPLSERREVIRGLRTLVAMGAEVVQVGYTHQLRGRTGSDYEFWDATSGMARQDDDERLVRERVNAGLRELAEARLFPLGWATPGGLASPFDYAMFGQIFSAMIERRFYGFSEGRPLQQRFPYAVWSDIHGQTVLSPNTAAHGADDLVRQTATARELTVVRDALGVVTVPVTTSARSLVELIGQMRQIGYEFTSLRALRPLRVSGEDVAVVSGQGRIRLDVPPGRYMRELEVDAGGVVRRVGLRRTSALERYEEVLSTPPGALRVVEIVNVDPWSLSELKIRGEILALPYLQRWKEAAAPDRLRMILALLLALLSGATVVTLALVTLVFPASYLAARIRRRPS